MADNERARDIWYDIFTPPDEVPSGPCAVHPDRVSQGTCATCGAGICIECRTLVEHEARCPTCAAAAAAIAADVPPLTDDDFVLRRHAPKTAPAPAAKPEAALPPLEDDGFILRRVRPTKAA